MPHIFKLHIYTRRNNTLMIWNALKNVEGWKEGKEGRRKEGEKEKGEN